MLKAGIYSMVLSRTVSSRSTHPIQLTNAMILQRGISNDIFLTHIHPPD